jgi:hypothetical protein
MAALATYPWRRAIVLSCVALAVLALCVVLGMVLTLVMLQNDYPQKPLDTVAIVDINYIKNKVGGVK